MYISKLLVQKYLSRSSMMVENISNALNQVRQNIKLSHEQFCQKNGSSSREPLLIAVSKIKPNDMIIEAYKCGQKDFGENYVQELVQKAKYFNEQEGYDDIRWHFIGHLQRNKVNNLLGAPNLYAVQTVDSEKLANALNKSWQKLRGDKEKLKVFAQVNTSGEVNKSGQKPEECADLVKHIMENCDSLELEGLMTIGAFNHDYSSGPNPDFICLNECRKNVCERLGMNLDDIGLSMGMSNDYQHAILCGSTNVRVGSTIFGARDKKSNDNSNESVNTENRSPEAKLKDLKIC